MAEYNIKKFDMKKLQKDSTIVLIGKRRTGKSFLMRDILYHKRDIPMGIVISHTEKISPFFQKFVPKICIWEEYNSKKMQDIFTRQKTALNKNWPNPYCFLVMDDCLSSAKTWSKDKNIKEIFFNGRHYKIFFMLAMQEPLGLESNLRGNVDYIFLHKNNNNIQIEKIFKHYAGVFPNLKVFKEVLNMITEDHRVMVIDNTNPDSNKIEDLVFHYKAEDHPDFKLCSDNVWRESERIYQESLKQESNNDYVKVRV